MARLYVLDYHFAMKYIWIIVTVVILVRIDFIVNFLSNTANRFQLGSSSQFKSDEITNNDPLISFTNDVAIKTSSYDTFLIMLENFKTNPDSTVKEGALEILKANPTMFTDKLDKTLESRIYQWRNLVFQKDKETQFFLMDLQSILRGENLEMVKKFSSLLIDADMREFLKLYSKSKDSNCLMISYHADQLAEEEKYNEYYERMLALETSLKDEKLDEDLKAYGTRCQMVLKLQLDKAKAALPATQDDDPMGSP